MLLMGNASLVRFRCSRPHQGPFCFLYTCLGLFCFITLQLEVVAQGKAPREGYPMEKSFFVTLSSGLTPRASIQKTEGTYTVTANAQPVWEAGVDYRTSLSGTLYSIIGFRTTVAGRNAVFDAPVEKINAKDYQRPFPPLKMIEYNVSVAAPVLLEKAWHLKPYRSVYVQGGVHLRYSLGYESESFGFFLTDTARRMIEVFSLDMNSNNGGKPWITYNLGGGYSWRLKNYNVLKAGIVGHLSFSRVVSGTYQVAIPGEPLTMGTYSATGSYVALSVSYGFTRNKKLLRAYEQRQL